MSELAGNRLVVLVLLGLGLALLAAPASLAQSGDGSTQNVLLTVRMGKIEGDRRVPVKTYDLVVVPGGAGSRLLNGARVAIPTAASSLGDDDATEMQAFAYQNIGFTSEVRAWIVDGKRIKISCSLEDSRIVEDEDGGPPTVETRQLAFDVILEDGKPRLVAQAEGLADQPGFVEVEARVLR